MLGRSFDAHHDHSLTSSDLTVTSTSIRGIMAYFSNARMLFLSVSMVPALPYERQNAPRTYFIQRVLRMPLAEIDTYQCDLQVPLFLSVLFP